ncbi:hypothetical protein [Pseudomonas amygdali]|uniref:Uncharacterized protein n=2 Tax=Pseudomonas amygdali pv. lachrymans TaxID=53707 RepID=A0ABR5KSU0_PSEAV|nr:hypothetical protein [Pseudomonas amygdali]AXH60322.1 hypothetical protein PLA107_034640 [Pseudomonas amygdali pv. lachrymans str. M301315]KPC17709.1 Uncharacterized protein AC499_0911 [Pseudomonas amygdali pv. lachrymans]
MKKNLSRYSFYLFLVGAFARLIWRALKICSVIYFRSLFETKFNFTLCNAVLFHSSKTIFDPSTGNVRQEYLPYMTEALQVGLLLSDSNPEPFEFTSTYAKRLTSVSATPEIMHGKIVDVMTNLFLTRTEPDGLVIPYNEEMGSNEVCFALWVGFSIDEKFLQSTELMAKITTLGLEAKEIVDCQANPALAQKLVDSKAFKNCIWAKKESIGIDLYKSMTAKGLWPPMNRLTLDDHLLSEWASQLPAEEGRHRFDDTELRAIASAAIKHSTPVSAALLRYRHELELYGLPKNLMQDPPEQPDDQQESLVRPLHPKGWKKQMHHPSKPTLLKMIKSGNPALKAEALGICRRYPVTQDLVEKSDDSDLYILHVQQNWKRAWQKYQERHHDLLPFFIRNHPKIIRHYAKDDISISVLMAAMDSIEEEDFIPRKIKRASLSKLIQIALIKGCPYAIFRLSKIDENHLLEIAREYPDYELIFNHCQNKRPENLERYPGKLRDLQFGADLGL